MSRDFPAGCLIFFASPFAAAGIFLAVVAARATSTEQRFLLASAALAFGAAGFGLIIAAVAGSRKPPTPVNGPIADSGEGSAITMWFFALIWNGVSAPIFVFAPREFAKGNHLALIAFIFPIIGLGLVIAAIRATAEVLRFGESHFLPDSLPVPVGGSLRGHVLVRGASETLADARAITARMTCYLRTRSGRSTSESVVCRNESQIAPGALQRTGQGVAIPIDIDVPPEGQPMDASDPARRISWTLTVAADVPGVDYDATFDIPVLGRVEAEPRLTGPVTAPATRSVIERQTADGLEIHFPAFRARGPALFLLFFLAIWCGAIAVMIVVHAPALFEVVFGFLALILVWVLLDLLFGSSTVHVGTNSVLVHTSMLFLSSDRDIARSDIQDVRTKIGMQSSGTPYYQVEIVLNDGKSVTAGKYLRNKREAEWIAGQIK